MLLKKSVAASVILVVAVICCVTAVLAAGNVFRGSIDPAKKALLEEKEKIGNGMSLGQAFVLGMVEGLTEYLPVSSTGHLLLAQKALGLGDGEHASGSPADKERNKAAADAYAICIQAGAIIAVIALYPRHLKQMIQGLMGKDRAGLRMAINIAAAFMPAAIIGLIFHKAIKEYLFGPWPIAAAWLAGGAAILVISRHADPTKNTMSGKSLAEMNLRMALLIGAAQCIAMWPGVSRSLVSILGGMLVGLSISAAVEFSFLLGLATLGAATLFDAVQQGGAMLETYSILSLFVGLFVAFISAVASVKWMVSYLNRHGLEVFGYYRIAIALIAAVLILTNIL
ncbi:MAG: undecaprenyl-diphosphate phosphatase [Syntrophobacteraceae bacterium]